MASAVQKIIQIAGKDSKVGEQVKTITETQAQSQEKLETSLQKVQSRGGLAKFFVGPDYGEINNTKNYLNKIANRLSNLMKFKINLLTRTINKN